MLRQVRSLNRFSSALSRSALKTGFGTTQVVIDSIVGDGERELGVGSTGITTPGSTNSKDHGRVPNEPGKEPKNSSKTAAPKPISPNGGFNGSENPPPGIEVPAGPVPGAPNLVFSTLWALRSTPSVPSMARLTAPATATLA